MIDIFLLLILHTTSRKKSVESLVRNKIRSGGITEALLQDVFSNHYEVRNMRMQYSTGRKPRSDTIICFGFVLILLWSTL